MKMNTSEVEDVSSAPSDICTATVGTTPASRVRDRGNPVLRTPLSGMSSSLKERLKRCGRYHPATPPSSRQSTPTSNLSCTPVSSPITMNTSASTCQGTPTRRHSNSKSLKDGTSPLSRTLPQPRNILKEKCVLSNHMEIESENFKSSVGSYTENESMNVKSSSEALVDYKRCSTVDYKGKNRPRDLDTIQAGVCSGAETPDRHSQSEDVSVINTSTVTVGKTLASAECEKELCSDKEDTEQESSAVDWREVKKTLTAKLAEQKETLRKLHMVKTYRAKHDLLELQGLIDKWRSTCQQAVLDLHDLTSDPRPSLTQLVSQIGIDQELVRYNAEDECFEED